MATKYVHPNGSSGNTGNTAGSPWPLQYAFSNISDGDTVIALNGAYASSEYFIENNGVLFQADEPRGAKLMRSTADGLILYPAGLTGIVIDGIEIAYATGHGLRLDGPGNTVKNCWLHHNKRQGLFTPYASDGATHDDNIVEYNLVEYNGYGYTGDQTLNHGIYVIGDDLIVRGNVIRFQSGAGLQVYGEKGNGDAIGWENFVAYSNLIYGNGTWGFTTYASPNGTGTRDVHLTNNTIIGGSTAACQIRYCTGYLHNNIIIGPTVAVGYSGGTIHASSDYNILSHADYSGAHNVITSTPGFANQTANAYWLTAGAAARNAADVTQIPAYDIHGAAQAAVLDIGAYQYIAAQTTTRRSYSGRVALGGRVVA